MPCPLYHNPADYGASFISFKIISSVFYLKFFYDHSVIELASGEYGEDKISLMVDEMGNGESLDWFSDPSKVERLEVLRKKNPLNMESMGSSSLHATSKIHQLGVLLKRSYIKAKRDTTLTYLR